MIIGKRELRLKTPIGYQPVIVSIHLPTDTGAGWECSLDIEWPGKTVTTSAMGDDALHALELAQQKIAIVLYMSGYHAAGELSWTDNWVGYGFPIPKNGRDLLIGDDQRFFGLDNT